MRIAVFTASALAALAFAAPAQAQDTDDATFTGPRAEAVVGWDHFGNDRAGTKDGVVYGGAIGYDAAMGGLLVGADAEVTGATTKVQGFNVNAAGDSTRFKQGRDLYVGARIGTIVTPGVALYVKGGYTNLNVDQRRTLGATTTSASDNLSGFRVGAGAEARVSGNIYFKAEYRYSKYEAYDNYNIHPSKQQVVGGVGIRF